MMTHELRRTLFETLLLVAAFLALILAGGCAHRGHDAPPEPSVGPQQEIHPDELRELFMTPLDEQDWEAELALVTELLRARGAE